MKKQSCTYGILANVLRSVAFALAAVVTLASFDANAQAPVFAPPVENVSGISVNGLEAYQGKFLTVFYVSANPSGIITHDRQTIIREIKAVLSSPINQGSIALQAMQIPITGFLSYSHVIFVVHDQPEFVWTNVDNSIVADPRGLVPSPANNASILVRALKRKNLEQLAAEQGNPALVNYILN